MVDTLPIWEYEILSSSVNLPSAQSSQKKVYFYIIIARLELSCTQGTFLFVG